MWNDMLRQLFIGVGRVGGRATQAAADSVLKDSLDTIDDARVRIQKFRAGLAAIVGGPPPDRKDRRE